MRDPNPAVVLFGTPSCGFCAATRVLFAELHIEYVEIDVSESREELQRLIWMTGRAIVPTVTVGEKTVIGFDRDALTSLFAPDDQDDDAEVPPRSESDGV